MKTKMLTLETGAARAIVDITGEVEQFVKGEGDGLVNVSLPHATAGLALMELGAGTEDDLWASIDRVLPPDARYVHSHGSKGHGASHVLPVYVMPTLTLVVQGSRVSLGTWQSIALIDPNVDNRTRQVLLAFGAALFPFAAQAKVSSAVLHLELDGVVDPFEVSYIKSGIEEAEATRARAILITIDTPGGLESSMRKIVQVILGARVPGDLLCRLKGCLASGQCGVDCLASQ